MFKVPDCDYCHHPAERVTGDVLYGSPRYANKVVWRCVPCKAWVGCHPGTEVPLGRLADAELRQAKSAAHAAFDPLWKRKMERDGCSQAKARGAAYKWLAAQLEIDRKDCHIGMMDTAMCRRVVRVCNGIRRREEHTA